ncbi:DUF523 domain-containing protein [Microbacterium sp. NC79]|uniref:DUF523 domain-containing protein n=1 Tax=Microbacterium sp. NC79 TaxID=2851009 RepID=UPI001C2BE6FD|nr:DUF523 domain-containing protein [Microbacterium sp. NC79]MBV0893944.1 DUF523 domain-containing protein [Microbacterium sp. NC79]
MTESTRTIVSACLAGAACRYDGRAKPDAEIVAAVQRGEMIPLCAEVLGELPTPRPAAEIVGGDGSAVLDGTARVVTNTGGDVTAEFVAGAERVADAAVALGATHAILQDRSPSCGCGRIYDGSFSGALIDGNGVTAAALSRRGLTITVRRGVSAPQASA